MIRSDSTANTVDPVMSTAFAHQVAEEVLVTQLACRGGATCGGRGEGGRVQMDSYDIGLVIAHDWQMGVAETTLALRYWVVLTQRDESFPKLKLEKKLGIHNSGLTKVYPASEWLGGGSVRGSLGGGWDPPSYPMRPSSVLVCKKCFFLRIASRLSCSMFFKSCQLFHLDFLVFRPCIGLC